jgi:hypothetical protein
MDSIVSHFRPKVKHMSCSPIVYYLSLSWHTTYSLLGLTINVRAADGVPAKGTFEVHHWG